MPLKGTWRNWYTRTSQKRISQEVEFDSPRAHQRMEKWKSYFSGKRITLMGLGLLGRGVGDAKFLAPLCAELIVTDLKNEAELADSLSQLKEFTNITFHLGGHRLEDFKDRDLVIKAAGVPLDSPFIAEAKKNNIPVRMSADLFMELFGSCSGRYHRHARQVYCYAHACACS